MDLHKGFECLVGFWHANCENEGPGLDGEYRAALTMFCAFIGGDPDATHVHVDRHYRKHLLNDGTCPDKRD